MATQQTVISISRFLQLSEEELQSIQDLQFDQSDRGVITHKDTFGPILEQLAKCTHLESFDPSYSPYTSGIAGGGIDITIDEFKQLCDVLEKIPSLTHLRLNFHGYYDGKKRQYYGDSEAPKTHKYLGDIDLSRFDFFCSILKRLPGLEELDLSFNHFGKMAAEKIRLLEESITRCRILKLVENDLSQLDDDAFEALCHLLNTLPNLEKIDLRGTGLGELGDKRFMLLMAAIENRANPIKDGGVLIGNPSLMPDKKNIFSELSPQSIEALFSLIRKCHPNKEEPLDIRAIINIEEQLGVHQILALGNLIKDYKCLSLTRDEIPSIENAAQYKKKEITEKFQAFCKVLSESEVLKEVVFSNNFYFNHLSKSQCADLGKALKKCTGLDFEFYDDYYGPKIYEESGYSYKKTYSSGFFEMVEQIENLEYLNVARGGIDKILNYGNVRKLSGILKSCKILDLSGNNFTTLDGRTFPFFFEMLSELPSLEKLKINFQYLSNEEIDNLYDILKNSRTLIEIDSAAEISPGNIRCTDPRKIARFSEICERNKKIKPMMDKANFDFADEFPGIGSDLTDLTDTQFQDVCEIMQFSQKLQMINLAEASVAGVHPKQLKVLAHSISVSPNLKKLDLSNNSLGGLREQPLMEFAATLSKCPHLKHIDLRGNRLESLEDAQFNRLCEILSQSKAIVTIVLDEDKLSSNKKESLLRALNKPTSEPKDENSGSRRMHYQHNHSAGSSSSSSSSSNPSLNEGDFPARTPPRRS